MSGAFEKAGYEVRPGPKLEEWFKDAGFVNIQVKKFQVPYGVWPKDRHFVSSSPSFFLSEVTDVLVQKEIGTWMQAGTEAGFEAGALAALTRYKEWTREEVIALASRARADGRNRGVHTIGDL